MAKPSLNKALHQPLLSLLQNLITLSNIIYRKSMSKHNRRVHFASLDPVEDVLPVFVDWRLAAPDELDTALHDGADVEVVGVYNAKSVICF